MRKTDRIEEMCGLYDHQFAFSPKTLSTRYSALPPVIKDVWAALRTTILEEALIVDGDVLSIRS
jgi:hypothetical protein